MKKRVLSLFLALTLCLTLTPTGALAEESLPGQTVVATQETETPTPAPQKEESTAPAENGADENDPPANPEENPTENAPAAAEKNTEDKGTGKEAGQNKPTAEGKNEPLTLGLDDPGQNAAEGENGEGSGGTHYVAESDGTQYETVQEILDNMEEGEITLLDSVTEDLTVYAATTIHMNGHSITGNIDATDSLTLNGGTVDGTVKVNGGTLNMTAPSDAAAAIDGGLNVVSGSAFVSGAQVGVKGTLYFDGTDMLISGAVKAVELDSAAEPAAKTLYGSATVNGDTAAEAGFDTDTYKVGGKIAKKLTNKQVGSTTPAAPSLTLTETSKSLTAGKTAVFTANYTGTDTLNAYVQGNAVNGYFTISQKNNGDGTYTVSVKIDEETPGGTYTLFVHEVGNTSVQASATITVIGLPDAAEVNGKQYKSLPRALNAAQDGDTVKLLANHVTDADALNALGEDFTFEQYASIVPVVTKTLTLDLNHKTVDYLEVGFSETNEETQKKETLATGNLTVTGEGAYGRISNLMFMAGALDIRSGEIGGSEGAGLVCDVNSGTATISNGTVYGLTVLEGASVTVNGGSNHRGRWSVDSGGTLSITGGTFKDVQFVNSGTIAISGGTFEKISNNDTNTPQPLMLLLAKDCAFVNENNTSDVQDGTKTSLTEVMVKEHTHTFENGKCDCGVAAIVVDNNNSFYNTLQAALGAAADDASITSVTLGQDLTEDITFSGSAAGSLTLNMNGHKLETEAGVPLTVTGGTLRIEGASEINQNTASNATAFPAIKLTGGKLVITGDLTAQGGYDSSSGRKPAIYATDGELDLQGNVSLNGGLTMLGNAKLTNLLTKGTFYAQDPNGNATADNVLAVCIRQEDVASDNYNTVLKLIADGYAIYKADGTIRNAAALTLKSDTYSIGAHTCNYTQDEAHGMAYCKCGRSHAHRDLSEEKSVLVNGVCPICGYHCPHNTVDETTLSCSDCGAKVVAKVEVEGSEPTYAFDLASAFQNAVNGTTIKLLANEMLPDGIYASKTLTLDLDGHSLSGYSLNVGGSTATGQALTGNLTVIDSSGGNGAVGVTVRDGGTLVFDPENDSTTLLQLEVWGGKVELHGGKILRKDLRLNNGITLGDLLPQKAGLAYYRDDTQLTLEEAASQTCDLVVKSCSHGGKNGFDKSATTCPYCGAPAVAETALNNGEGNRPWRRFADLQTALDAYRDGGATLKLLADVTGDYTIDGTKDTGLNLNGHSIKGTVTVKAAAGNNTTTLSNTENTATVSIDKVVAYKGAKLAGSGKPAVIGELTLADGATWKNILNLKTLGYKVLNADGTHKWYAPNDVKDSQLKNVIINSLPITSKTLYLKVNGKNLTGNSPKVERGTTVQLCASCNAKDANVSIYIGEIDENNEPKYSLNKAEYKKIGTSWYYVVNLDANKIGTYDIYFTATKDGYTVTSNHKKLTVTKPNLSNAEITFPDGNEAAFNSVSATGVPMFVVTYNGTKLEENVDFVITRGASTYDVGPCTLTIKATDNGDYTGSKSAEWNVRPLKVAASVGDIIKTYDGTTDLPANAKITFKSADSYYTGRILPLAKGTDYEVSNAHYDSADASETEKNISFTVKLTDTNYTFEDGTTEKAFTLNGADFDNKTFQINKATIASDTQLHQTVFNDLKKTYEIDLNQVLDKILPEGGTYGDIKYGRPGVSMYADYYPAGGANIENGKLRLSINKAASFKQGKEIGTVTVQVETTNYQPFTLTIHVSLQDKLVPVLAEGNTVSASEITYGQTLADSKLTVNGTMKDPNTSATVDGTFTWTDGTIKPDAGSYDAEWTFTPAEGYEEYATATGTVTVKVNKATPTFTAPTAQENLTYTGQEQELITAGMTDHGTMQYSLTENGTYSQDTPTGTDAGAYTVWYRVIGDENHNDTAPASVAVRIGKKPLTITGVTAASKPYDGTTNADISSVTFDNVTLNRGTDYTVTANFDDASVDSGKNITATVTLMEQAAKNYALEQSSFPTTGSIIKAAAPDFTKETALTIVNGHEKTYTVTLPALPTLETPKEYGALTYEIGEIKLNDGYYTSGAKVENGELTLPIQKNDVETTGSVGTVTVVIKSANYEDITLTVNVSAKNRITPTGTPTLSKNAIIYGDALNTIALSGKLHDNVNNVDVDGTFEWVDGTHIPAVGNGTYAAEWIFEPTDTEKYLTVSGRSNITVEKARQYGKLSMAGYTYGKTPSTPTLTDQTGDLNAQVTYSYAAADSGSVQTWNISNPPALNAGTYRMYASIGDTDNYYGFEAVYCEFVVAKATPTYTVPTELTAKYGQTLANVTLPDGWSWMDSSESVGGASTAAKTFPAKFTPKDTENYNTVENIELEVTVNKADGGNLKTVELEQKYTDASDHTYTPDWAGLPAGQDWTFSSEASIVLPKQDFVADGNLLTYAISGGKAGDKITLILKASCDNYEDFTITLNVTLTEKDDQKPLTITGNTSVIYGEKLTLTTTGGSGMGAVTYRIDTDASTGEATIDPETGVLTPVKVGSVSVIATKAGDNNYNDVTSAPFVLMIKPATPTGEPNYTIKATAGAGGSISPSGNVSVREGGDQTFTITPDKGYAVANVKIDGKSIGAVKSYTFENVSSPHTIEAIFVKGTASASTGDSSNLPLWSALLLVSTLALAGAVHLKRKRAR